MIPIWASPMLPGPGLIGNWKNLYQALIDSGYADGVMTSHIVNKNLDHRALPGTLSKSILDSILRKRMKFDGVVFTDDMQMKAIASNFGLEEAIKLAVNAGVDIMCFSNNIQGVEERTVDKVHGIIKNYAVSFGGGFLKKELTNPFGRIMKTEKVDYSQF